jgi:predicted outer membrane protein
MSCKPMMPALVVALMLAAGCSTPASAPKDTAAAPVMDGRCHADAAQFAVGKPITPALLEQARARSGAQVARGLMPNDMITLDYRSERLNLNADATGKVIRANCG